MFLSLIKSLENGSQNLAVDVTARLGNSYEGSAKLQYWGS